MEPIAKLLGVGVSAVPYIAIALLVLLVLYGLYLARDTLPKLSGKSLGVTADAPKVMFGMDVRVESLPEDIPERALNLLENGDIRAAVSLLYRESLVKGLHLFEIPFTDSDTEYECLARVEQTDSSPFIAMFGGVTRAWLQLAYAHRPVQQDDVQTLLAQWQEVFVNE